MAPGSGTSRSRAWTSCSLPSETWMKLGMLPRRSSSVCIFTAALVVRKCAQGTTDRHRSMVVELGVLGRQTHFDVAQALAVGQLGEGHDPELLRARQRANVLVASIARDVAGKSRPWQEIHELGEQRLASVHGGLRAKAREIARIGKRCSNRHHPSWLGNPHQSWLSEIR